MQDIPKALLGVGGAVDALLLQDLFKYVESPSKTVRNLLRLASKSSARKDKSRFEELALQLPDRDFREKWYRDSDLDRRGLPPPLFKLIQDRTNRLYPNLNFHEGAVSLSFEERDGRRFPLLHKVDRIVDELLKVPERDAAIAAWSWFENCAWGIRTNGPDQALLGFREAVLAELRQRSATLLFGFLTSAVIDFRPPNSNSPSSTVLSLESPATNVVQVGLARDGSADMAPYESVFPGFTRAISELEGLWASYLRLTEEKLSTHTVPETLLRDREANVVALRSCLQELDRKASDVVHSVSSRLSEIRTLIPVKITSPTIMPPSKAGFDQWRETFGDFRDLIIGSINAATPLRDIPKETIGAAARKFTNTSVDISQLTAFCEDLAEEAQLLDRSARARNHLKAQCDAHWRDLSWNPLLDASSSRSVLIDFGRGLLRDEKLTPILGILVRECFSELAEDLCVLLEGALSKREPELRPALVTLSRLTLPQIEDLGGRNRELAPLLAIAELESTFATTINDATGSSRYWQAKPLSEYWIAHDDRDERNVLFHALLTYVTAEGVAHYRSDVCSIVARALSGRPSERSSDKTAELRKILTFHRGGGGNYAQLWKLAYTELFAPLLKCLEQRGLTAFQQEYARWRDTFRVEDRLHFWKATLPIWVRKNSEYDKKIRLAIRTLCSSIDEALHSGIGSAQQSLRGDQVTLIEAVARIGKSADGRTQLLKAWLNDLAAGTTIDEMWPVCARDSDGADWDAPFPVSASVWTPRAFTAHRRGKQRIATYGDLASDELVAYFGYGSARHLADAYVHSSEIEAFYALLPYAESDLPDEIIRQAEAKAEELESQFGNRLEQLKRMLETIPEGYSSEAPGFDLAASYLSERKFHACDEELQVLEYAYSELLRSATEAAERGKLCAGIAALGGLAGENDSTEELRERFGLLWGKAAPRREHIELLKTLLPFESAAPTAIATLKRRLLAVEDPVTLPAPDQSGYFALALGPAIKYLRDELSQIEILKPSYAQKLRALADTLVSGATDPSNVMSESSPLTVARVQLEGKWTDVARAESKLSEALRVFESMGLIHVEADGKGIHQEIAERRESPEELEAPPEGEQPSQEAQKTFDDQVREWVETLLTGAARGARPRIQLNEALANGSWEVAVVLATHLLRETPQDEITRRSERLADLAIVGVLAGRLTLSIDTAAGLLSLANRHPKSAAVQAVTTSRGRSDNHLTGIIREFLVQCAKRIDAIGSVTSEGKGSVGELLEALGKRSAEIPNLRHQLQVAFDLYPEDKRPSEPLVVRELWNSFTGDKRQDVYRAALMNLLWRASATRGLAFCLMQCRVPERRQALALARAANDAALGIAVDGLRNLVELKSTIGVSAFHIFVDEYLHKFVPNLNEDPATLSMVGPIEQIEGGGQWRGVLEINPRRTFSPDTLTIELPPNAPVRFGDGSTRLELKGPYFSTVRCPVEFRLLSDHARNFPVELTCMSKTITGQTSNFATTIQFRFANAEPFAPLLPEQLEAAFDDFPARHLRQRDKLYVHRGEDERRIEKLLFAGSSPRSIWIASPRRSGKTTMLFWILDSYSHKEGRDSAVAYFTLDKSFSNDPDFNRWIWDQIQEPDNVELVKRFKDVHSLGRVLPRDQDVKRFLGALVDGIKAQTGCPRVVFLLDEIDKFTQGYLKGGVYKDFVESFMWQVRHLLSSRNDFAFVFSGAPSSLQFFVREPKAAFYNMNNVVNPLRLTPFSGKGKKAAETRAIVFPRAVEARYTLPDESLEFLARICAGIPYYMRLVAGATFAVAEQSYVLEQDVANGLAALLNKKTGLPGLDEASDPVADEYSNLSASTRGDEALARAVLLTAAKLHSPISGARLRRGQLWSQSSPLVSQCGLSKEQISIGLDICEKLDLLTTSEDSPDLRFAIPILGESLRRNFGRHWADIEEDIERLGNASVN